MAIGIWGYGKVGKALIKFFLEKSTSQILVMDKNEVNLALLGHFKERILLYTEAEKDLFFHESLMLFASPGVNIRGHYQTFKKKWNQELDLFFSLWQKKIISITGSNGKTSTTHFLHTLLKQYNLAVVMGGNIGIPTIELIENQTDNEYALLEVSSFQLEYTQQFAPDLAIITNLSENHLDRHETMEAYFQAKYNNIRYQKHDQKALIPLNLYKLVMKQKPKSRVSVFASNPTQAQYAELKRISKKTACFIIDSNQFFILQDGLRIHSIDLPDQKQTFDENILILISTLFLLECDIQDGISYLKDLQPLEHRFEFVANKNGIDFYNDSKSTTMQSTLAAINEFKNKNIFLLVGGLSKGVNRAPLFEEIKNKVSFIGCFGGESEQLSQFCTINNIPHSKHDQLTDAFQVIVKEAQKTKASVILFSPAGSSYDLFKNYEDRGSAFKKLVSYLLSN